MWAPRAVGLIHFLPGWFKQCLLKQSLVWFFCILGFLCLNLAAVKFCLHLSSLWLDKSSPEWRNVLMWDIKTLLLFTFAICSEHRTALL